MPHMIPPGPGVPRKSFHFDPFNRIIEDDDIQYIIYIQIVQQLRRFGWLG